MPKAKKPRKKSRARRIGHAIKHAPKSLLAVLIGGAAVLVPFAKPGAGGNSVATSIAKIAQGDIAEIEWIGGNFISSVESNWLEMLGLGLVASGTAYAGKKLGGTRATRINNKWSAV